MKMIQPSRSITNTLKTIGVSSILATTFMAPQSFALSPSNTGSQSDAMPFKTVKDNPKVAEGIRVYRPANLKSAVAATGGPLPLIVWANGGCTRADFAWNTLLKGWAERGFVVVALSTSDEKGALAMTNDADHSGLIDWALSNPELADVVDQDGIIAVGNSCGGVTALQMTAEDDRVDGIFVLSGSSAIGTTNKKVMSAIKVPVGYITGGEEDIAGGPAKKDYAALSDGIPAMVINKKTGTHMEVSQTKEILVEVTDMSYHWIDLIINGSKASFDELNSANVCSDCTPGDWTLTAKNLDALVK